jgi:hypothetical protein
MGQDPAEIREEIAQTREDMGQTVDALGHKADVKGRVAGYVTDKKDALMGTASEKMPDGAAVKEKGWRVGRTARENPIGLAVAGAATGFLVGLALPSTRMEDDRIGEVADDLKERVRETGQQALESGKEVACETASTAVETAREASREKGGELSSQLQEGVGQATSGSTDPERR